MDKKLKKNKAIRAAGALFVATMFTTNLVCGNYARYVTTDQENDSARTSAFGVYVTGSGNLFDETYYDVDQDKSNEPAGKSGDGTTPASVGISVKSMARYDGGDVVAPGTKNSEGVTISVTGVPEVDVKIEYSMPEELIEDIYLNEPYSLSSDPELKNYYIRQPGATNLYGELYPDMTDSADTEGFTFKGVYYPLEFTLTGNALDTNRDIINTNTNLNVNESGEDAYVTGSLKEIADVMEELNSNSKIYKAGTNLADEVGDLTLTWEWKARETDTTTRIKGLGATTDITNGYNGNLIDKMDTLLGDLSTWTYDTSGDGKVTVEDFRQTNYGFITTITELEKDSTFFAAQGVTGSSIATHRPKSANIFVGLFGNGPNDLTSGAPYYNSIILDFVCHYGSGFYTAGGIWSLNGQYIRAKNVQMLTSKDPSTGQFWLEAKVDLSVTVTQVD